MKSIKTREKILNVSIDLFNNKKASNVSTVQISTAMNISPGNLYYYFANKEEIIRCIWNERMLNVINGITDKAHETKSIEDLLNNIEEWIEHIIEYRFFYSELSTLFINDESIIEMYHSSEKNTIATFAELLNKHIASSNIVDNMIVIHSAMAISFQQLCQYDTYIASGKTRRDYINLNMLRITTLLEAVFSNERINAINEELSNRGLTKKMYLELYS